MYGARKGRMDRMSDAGAVAPIGCPKTDTRAVNRCTSAEIARRSRQRTQSSLTSRSISSGKRFRCV